MLGIDPDLRREAEGFADQVAEVLTATVVNVVTVAARVQQGGNRFTVALSTIQGSLSG